jgi:hypothetical protein
MITLREGVYKAKNHRIYNWMKTKKIIFGFVQERVTPIYMAYLIGKITINQEILSLPTVRQTCSNPSKTNGLEFGTSFSL